MWNLDSKLKSIKDGPFGLALARNHAKAHTDGMISPILEEGKHDDSCITVGHDTKKKLTMALILIGYTLIPPQPLTAEH